MAKEATVRANFFDALEEAEFSVRRYNTWIKAFEKGQILSLNRREDSGAVNHNLSIGVSCIRHKDWFFFYHIGGFVRVKS